jgi:hypothetical protein
MRIQLRSFSSLAAAIIFSAVGGIVSCQSHPDGYWTRPDRSQALTNQEYPDDSQECQAMAASNGMGKDRPYQARLFTRCMQAKGYQWLVEPRVSHPLKDASVRPSPSVVECGNGRLITDAFGYQKCVPIGMKDGGMLQEARSAMPPKFPLHDQTNPSTLPMTQPDDGRGTDDAFCRQYAKESLSGTYSVYSQCMMDKGWASKP